MTELLVSGASTPAADGTILSIEPESVGFEYVGFEVLALQAGATAERACGYRELCVVVISGTVNVASEHGEWFDIGGEAHIEGEASVLVERSHEHPHGVGRCCAKASSGISKELILRLLDPCCELHRAHCYLLLTLAVKYYLTQSIQEMRASGR